MKKISLFIILILAINLSYSQKIFIKENIITLDTILEMDSTYHGFGFVKSWMKLLKIKKFEVINDNKDSEYSHKRVYMQGGVYGNIPKYKVYKSKLNLYYFNTIGFVFDNSYNLDVLFNIEKVKKIGKSFNGIVIIENYSINQEYTYQNLMRDFKNYIYWESKINEFNNRDVIIVISGYFITFRFNNDKIISLLAVKNHGDGAPPLPHEEEIK